MITTTVQPLGQPATRFRLADDLAADAPPERRGLARDAVRLLVAGRDGVAHVRFADLPRFLRPGDLLVVNTSATVPAALDADRDGSPVVVHVSTELDDGAWVVELRSADAAKDGPLRDGRVGQSLALPGGASLRLEAAYPDGSGEEASRLWRARASTSLGLQPYLRRHGRPIRYGYVDAAWPLSDYQTVFAHEPGSAEMPSAGRPFTTELVTTLVVAGVLIAPVLLHTGVSSLDAGERPYAEWFHVPGPTARLVEHVRASRGRVVAVGTTVARALEAAADRTGSVEAASGWTDVVIGPGRGPRVVDGLVTGLHAPESSHLHMLEAIAGAPLVQRAYAEAVRERYRWHEFGDSCLLLP